MRKTFVHGVGGVLSADIAVPEHERELKFYSAVLTTGHAPLWRDDLMNNLGTPIIGLGARTPEYDSLPLQWMPHFQVADVATSASRAAELGGVVLMQSKSGDGSGQWAVLTDANGAAFGLIPAVDDPGAQHQKEHFGHIAWLSLIVPEAQSSCDFYRQVIGWDSRPAQGEHHEQNDTHFEMLLDAETAAAEILQQTNEPGNVPSVWLIHIPVSDLNESLQRVSQEGGDVIEESAEEKYAIVRDPVGVYLALRAI